MTVVGSMALAEVERNDQILSMLWRHGQQILLIDPGFFGSITEVWGRFHQELTGTNLMDPHSIWAAYLLLKNKLRQCEWHAFENLIKVMDLPPQKTGTLRFNKLGFHKTQPTELLKSLRYIGPCMDFRNLKSSGGKLVHGMYALKFFTLNFKFASKLCQLAQRQTW